MAWVSSAFVRSLRGVAIATAVLAGCALAAASPAVADTVPGAATAAADATHVFNRLNAERSWHLLAPLHRSTRLNAAAHAHNLKMAKYNTMSHQLPGEAGLGARITATGYSWSTAGENIGVSGDWSLAAILLIQKRMYEEVAPNNGHRLNILSRAFRDVGIDVYMDAAHHKAWLTEVFAAPL